MYLQNTDPYTQGYIKKKKKKKYLGLFTSFEITKLYFEVKEKCSDWSQAIGLFFGD